MTSGSQMNRYKKDSLNRANEIKQLTSSIPTVHYLEGTIVEHDGVKFGGTGMWYDFAYGTKVMGKTFEDVRRFWNSIMNDSNYIRGLPFVTLDMFQSEYKRLTGVIDEADVIVTHVSPDWSKTPFTDEEEVITSFYFFNGEEFYPRIANKIWCFGHIHEDLDYRNHGCRFINAAIGYPGQLPLRTFKTVEIGK